MSASERRCLACIAYASNRFQYNCASENDQYRNNFMRPSPAAGRMGGLCRNQSAPSKLSSKRTARSAASGKLPHPRPAATFATAPRGARLMWPRFDLEALMNPSIRIVTAVELRLRAAGDARLIVPASACGRERLGGALAKRDISAWRKPLGLEWQWISTRPQGFAARMGTFRHYADKTYGSFSPRVIHLDPRLGFARTAALSRQQRTNR
jgi:hypothetical protein